MFIDVIAFCDTFYGRPICPEQNGPAVSVQTCGGLRPNYGSVHFCQYCIYVNVVAILQQKAHFSASLDEKLGMGFCSGLPQRAALIFVNIPSSLSPSLGRNRPDQCHPKNRGVPPGCWGKPILGWETQSSLWLWKPRPQKQLIKSLDPISKSKREVSTQCHPAKQNSFQDLGPLMSTMVHVRGKTSSWWLGLLPAPFTQVIHGGMIAKCRKKLIQSPINGDTHFCCYCWML